MEQELKELAEWLEAIKIEANTPQHIEYYDEEGHDEREQFYRKNQVNIQQPVFLEKSKLYNEVGFLWNVDPLYEKLNNTEFEDISDLKVISKYLSRDELKERLIYSNFMTLETEVVVENYMLYVESKTLRSEKIEIERKMRELESKRRTFSDLYTKETKYNVK